MPYTPDIHSGGEGTFVVDAITEGLGADDSTPAPTVVDLICHRTARPLPHRRA